MGLYESEISKQIHLRNKQRKEWEAMKKKLEVQPSKGLEVQRQLEEVRRLDDAVELKETQASKKLASAMVKSAKGGVDDTLQKAVDFLNNQNGMIFF